MGARIGYIDLARGLLIVSMIVVHAATPCEPEIRKIVQQLWVLGIATTGFTMLAGYTAGVRYTLGVVSEASKMHRRALELLVVMFYTNLSMTLVKLYLSGEVESVVTWPWFIGLFSFQTPYNISGVLLPISIVLLLCPYIYMAERCYGRFIYIYIGAVVLALLSPLGASNWHPTNPFLEASLDLFIVEGPGGFAIIPFVGFGILGFATARVLEPHLRNPQQMGGPPGARQIGVLASWFVGVFYLIYTLREYGDQFQALYAYLKSEVMFLCVLVLAGYLHDISRRVRCIEMFGLLGRQALLAFVVHRVIGNGLHIILSDMSGGYSTFAVHFLLVTAMTAFLCAVRERVELIDCFARKLLL